MSEITNIYPPYTPISSLTSICERIESSILLTDCSGEFVVSESNLKQLCEGLLAVCAAIAILDGNTEVPEEVRTKLLELIDNIVEARRRS